MASPLHPQVKDDEPFFFSSLGVHQIDPPLISLTTHNILNFPFLFLPFVDTHTSVGGGGVKKSEKKCVHLAGYR